MVAFSSKVYAFNDAELDRAQKRLNGRSETTRDEARSESRRQRNEINSAYATLVLFADANADKRLIDAAKRVIDRSTDMVNRTGSKEQLSKRRSASNEAIENFLQQAARRLR